MYNLNDKIRIANNMIDGVTTKYNLKNNFSSIYPFTTENISGYINSFELKDKSLLTVGSSSDQVLNAMINGCEDITLLDVNIYAKYYYYLKVSALLNLDKEDYIKFFKYKSYHSAFKDNYKAFNKDVFNKFKYTIFNLDEESFYFWEDLFYYKNPLDIREHLFSMDESSLNEVINTNQYLQNEVAYNYLKKKIENINPKFIEGDIFKINISNKYDNIWLSNIATYLKYSQILNMTNKAYDMLNDRGMVLVSYLYNTTKDTKYNNDWCEIYNLEYITKDLLEDYKTFIEEFKGIDGYKFNSDKFKDSALILKK